MAQLVGATCALCAGRIGNTLEAAFCPTCSQPHHLACKQPSPGVEGRCASCGGAFDPARREAELREEAKAAAARRVSARAMLREAQLFYRFAGLFLAGLLIVGVGMLLIFSSELRTDPAKITTEDVLRGLVTVLAGLTVIGLAWWAYRSARRKARAASAAGLVRAAADLLSGGVPDQPE